MRKDLILGVVLAAMAGPASAAFSDQDTNDDGQISKDEYYGMVSDAGLYTDWDTDGDGLLDAEEFSDIGVDAEYDAWDENDDGYVDSGEYYDGVFANFDENEDGHWDNGEWDDAGDAGWFDV